MRKIKIILFICIALQINAIVLNGQLSGLIRTGRTLEREQEYYFAFTEATKFYLFGNYNQAIALYNECLKIKPQSGAVYYQIGRMFLISGETDKGREYTKKAVLFDGMNIWYLQQLADLYQFENKLDSAVMIYKRLVNLKKDDLNSIYNLAILHEKLKDYKEALYYLDKIENEIGISKEVSLAKYRIYENEGNAVKALEKLKQAYDLSGREYTIAGIMAEYYNNNKMPDSAKFYYQKIYPEYRNDPVVSFSYADYLMTGENYKEAKEVLLNIITDSAANQELITGFFYKLVQQEDLFLRYRPLLDSITEAFYLMNGNDIRARAIYADLEFKLKNYSKAALSLERIVLEDKRNYPALEQLIYAYNLLDSSKKVVKWSHVGIEVFKEKPILYLFGGAGNYRLKKYNDAAELLEKGLALSGTDALRIEFLSLLGEVYEQLKQYEKSENAFIQALKIDENNNGVRNNFAYYLSLRKKNLNYAAKLSKATVKAESSNDTYLDTYGWILYQMGKIRKAQKFIERALLNNGSKNPEILLHYGELLISLGRKDDALLYLEKAKQYSTEDNKKDIMDKINMLNGK